MALKKLQKKKQNKQTVCGQENFSIKALKKLFTKINGHNRCQMFKEDSPSKILERVPLHLTLELVSQRITSRDINQIKKLLILN
jgi:hypothetical protein